MYNTAIGLFIAVVCMVAHLILSAAAKRVISELESFSLRLREHAGRAGGSGVHSRRRQVAGGPAVNAAQVRARARMAMRAREEEIEQDEIEGGELNLVPYLDIITNVVLFCSPR
jgi:hypothetical protein